MPCDDGHGCHQEEHWVGEKEHRKHPSCRSYAAADIAEALSYRITFVAFVFHLSTSHGAKNMPSK
eukprot:scaffold20885_cov44-Prasinocladus_malaysianus.AAC.2